MKGDGGYILLEPSLHASGRRYVFDAGYGIFGRSRVELCECPTSLLDRLLGASPRRARGSARNRQRADVVARASATFVGAAFRSAGWLGPDLPSGAACARCPWLEDHSDGRGDGADSSCVVLPATKLPPVGGFSCQHAHCRHRTLTDALRKLPVSAAAQAATLIPEATPTALRIARGWKGRRGTR